MGEKCISQLCHCGGSLQTPRSPRRRYVYIYICMCMYKCIYVYFYIYIYIDHANDGEGYGMDNFLTKYGTEDARLNVSPHIYKCS